MANKKTTKKRIIKGRDFNEDKRQDSLRSAKPFGYRFRGDSRRKPTAKEIKEHNEGLRSDIYFEGRVERADKSGRAKKGERFDNGGEIKYDYERGKNYPVKTVSKDDYEKLGLENYPNFSKTGSISGMKKQYYGKDALLVKCGNYIYNVTSNPEIYFNDAYEYGGEIESEKYKKGGKVDRSKSAKKPRVKRTKKAIAQDKNIKALHGGKRISESGSVYYEYRENRQDSNRTKKLSKGGDLSDYELEIGDMEYAMISNKSLSALKKEYKNEIKNEGYSVYELPKEHPDRKRGNKWGLFKPKESDNSDDNYENEEDKLEYIGSLIKNGNTSGYYPNWSLEIDFDGDLEDSDYEHIGKSVSDGFTSGQIVSGEEEKTGWWSIDIQGSYAKGGKIVNEGGRIIGKTGSKYKAKLYKIEAIDRDKKSLPNVVLYKDNEKDLRDAVSIFLEEEFVEAELFEKRNGKYANFSTEIKLEKGGKLGFEGLAKKVAKEYEGDKVKPEYQDEYGKRYDKEEAKEVGQKVAAKVYREQQGMMEQGGEIKSELTLSEIESKLGKTFGFWDVPYEVKVDGVTYRKAFMGKTYRKI